MDKRMHRLIEAAEQVLDRLDTHGSVDPIREEGPIEDLRNAIANAIEDPKIIYFTDDNGEEIEVNEFPIAGCPICGNIGILGDVFSLLSKGFNGIKEGDPDDVNRQECAVCGALLRWDPEGEHCRLVDTRLVAYEDLANIPTGRNVTVTGFEADNNLWITIDVDEEEGLWPIEAFRLVTPNRKEDDMDASERYERYVEAKQNFETALTAFREAIRADGRDVYEEIDDSFYEVFGDVYQFEEKI